MLAASRRSTSRDVDDAPRPRSTDVDAALTAVNTTRASLGAGQSRLESVGQQPDQQRRPTCPTRGRGSRTPISRPRPTNLAKAQILSQASTAMLAQANQSQQNVLSLLR